MYLRHLTGYTYIKGYFLVYSLGDKGAPKRRTQKDLGLGSSDDNQDAFFSGQTLQLGNLASATLSRLGVVMPTAILNFSEIFWRQGISIILPNWLFRRTNCKSVGPAA